MSLFHADGRNSCITEDALFDVMSILQAGLIASGKGKEKRGDRRSSSPFDPFLGERSRRIQQRPVEAENYGEWKLHQDAIHWIHLARAQEKELQFWQTRSRGIAVHDTVPTDCVENVVYTPLDPSPDETEEEFNDDLSKPSKVHHKSKCEVSREAVY